MHPAQSPSATLPPEPPPQSAESGANAIHEAMLNAIGDLSDDERERLTAHDQPAETVRAWRDLIAERAAREREQSLRQELQRESLAAQPQPTRGLQMAAPPPAAPTSATEWTEWIHGSDDPGQQSRRRAEFANWLAAHPEA